MGLFFILPLLVLAVLCGSFIYFRRLKKKATREAHETAGLIDNWDRSLPQSKNPTKSVLKRILFVGLNLFLILVLAVLVLVYVTIYTGEYPIVLLATWPADLAFVIIGVLLIVLSRFFRISVLNQALPFIALAYASAMYFIVAFTLENKVILLVAASIGVLLGVWTAFTAARNLAKVGPGWKG